jgi:hypothetical protein
MTASRTRKADMQNPAQIERIAARLRLAIDATTHAHGLVMAAKNAMPLGDQQDVEDDCIVKMVEAVDALSTHYANHAAQLAMVRAEAA